MAKLTAAKRKEIPSEEFGLPGEKKYPMPDREHAANAKARATQQEEKGNLSKSSEEKIDAKANKILKKDMGGFVDDEMDGLENMGKSHHERKHPVGMHDPFEKREEDKDDEMPHLGRGAWNGHKNDHVDKLPHLGGGLHQRHIDEDNY